MLHLSFNSCWKRECEENVLPCLLSPTDVQKNPQIYWKADTATLKMFPVFYKATPILQIVLCMIICGWSLLKQIGCYR